MATTITESKNTNTDNHIEKTTDQQTDTASVTDELPSQEAADCDVVEEVTKIDAIDEGAENDNADEAVEDNTVDEATETDVAEEVPEVDVADEVTESIAQEYATESDEAEEDAIDKHRDHLNNSLEEEQTKLDDMQEGVINRLQAEDESGSLEESELDMRGYTVDISQERSDILAIVRSLEKQTDTSSKYNDFLEGEIDSLKGQLSKETSLRSQLEEKLKALETDRNTMAQLREENESLKEARDKLATLLEEIRPQLDAVTEGRDMLSEEVALAEKQIQELASTNTDLEIQANQLQEQLAETEQLRAKVSKIKDEHQVSIEQVRRLLDRLEEATKVRDTLEADLAASHEAMCQLQKEKQKLQDAVTDDGSLVLDLRSQLLSQDTKLAAANKKVQQETTARRQTEEMFGEIKSRLLSLSNNKLT